MNQIFISYSRKDTEFARSLVSAFAEQKLDIWVDWEDIPPSVDWMKEIEKGIEEANIFIFIISPDSIASKVCGEELAHAVKNGKRIIPVVARDVDMANIPASISHVNWVFFSRPQDKFEEAHQKLMVAIHTDFDWVQTHSRLQVKALDWERGLKEKSLLLRGNELKEAEAQVLVNIDKAPAVTALQREYVLASRIDENAHLEIERAKEQQLELEKKLGTRLRLLTYLLLGVFTVAYVALFFWLNSVTNTLAINALKNQMLALVETSVCFINGAEYSDFIASFPSETEDVYGDFYYSRLDFFMNDVIATNSNIETEVVLYTIIHGERENEYQIIASTDAEKDVAYRTTIPATPTSPQIAGLEKTVADTTIVEDEWGTWISACAPIHSPETGSVGALCADFNADLLEETRQQVTSTLGGAFLAVYPAMIALVIFTTRSFGKKRKETTK